MTRLVYKKRFSALPGDEGAIILKEISGVGTDEVSIELQDLPSGYIRIGDLRVKTASGRTKLNLSSLKDGLHTPIYTVGTHSFLCSPFIKRQGALTRPLPDGGDISRLESLISEQSERITALEGELCELKRSVGNKTSVNL